MKRLLIIVALGGLVAGCASNRGTYDDSWDSEGAMINRGSNMESDGPGMHSPTRTGQTGPGTTGATNNWEWQHGLRP
jgi:hypothetical protein